jgi:hypothetical protein
MKRGNDSGSDNMVFSVFYGTSLLACREAKPGRVILGRRIIGTIQRHVYREEVHEFTADPLQTVQYERDFLPILVTVAVILRVSPISPFSYSPDRLAAVQ